jgi:hypothetical protein
MNRLPRIPIATGLAATGYLHADLYLHGYRTIASIGPSFLVFASLCLALAVLELVAVVVPEPLALRLAAGAVAAAALGGFVLSRTVGLFGFTERGLQPAPQALLSVLAELAVVLLVTITVRADLRRTRPTGEPGTP